MIATNPQTALLVIDVQSGLFEKTNPIYAAQQVLDTICRLMDQAHAARIPVIIVQHNNNSFLKNGSPGWQLHPKIQPLESDIILQKHHSSAFEKTGLKKELDQRSVRQVIVSGLVSHGCVRAACLGALKLGYQVVLVSDAHSNFAKNASQVVEKVNQELSQAGVQICPAGEIKFANN